MSYAVTASPLMVRETLPPATNPALDAARLIGRYPDLSSSELSHLIALFPRLSALDAALMTTDDELRPRLEAFRRDHRSKIRTPFRQYSILVAIAAAGISAAVWAAFVGS